MTIAVVYVYPQVNYRMYFPLAQRFASTYERYVPTTDHQLYVAMNGGDEGALFRRPFDGIKCQFLSFDNVGWDIGAYQKSAERMACDLLVCLGAPVHFHQPQWLEQMADAYVENGPGLYGCWCFNYPMHVRTTAFWCPPELLNSYPYSVGSSRKSRYEFEHGHKSLTRHVLDTGFNCFMVSRTGVYPYPKWQDHVPGHDDSLVWDQFTHRPSAANLKARAR